MPSLADRIADMNTTNGFLVPVYAEDPLPGREVTYALTPTDMEKVRQGYACPACLADFGQFYRAVCPMCQHVRDVNADFAEAPQMWIDHLAERNGPATTTRAPSIDDAIARVMRDPNVEHATTKQLRPSKWGQGRPK
jgi:hypothetical protein